MKIKSILQSSLEKIFPESKPENEHTNGSALCGERYGFQLALWTEDIGDIFLEVSAQSAEFDVSLFEVGLAPSVMPCFRFHDDDVITHSPGLFPDILFPYSEKIRLTWNKWKSIWVEVSVPENAAAKTHEIKLTVKNIGGEHEIFIEKSFNLEVIGAVLPKQTLKRTEWFHNDCIAALHHVDVFCEEHWSLIHAYMKHAVRYGINMIYVPVFTPPLDTEIGGERPTVQLVDVFCEGNGYTFGFDKLLRYLNLAREAGFAHFEIAHLFTQWGAAHAPKIIGSKNGETVKLFGWETDAHGAEYSAFLNQFLPALRAFLEGENLLDLCYFHISDEPNADNAESYKLSRNLVQDALAGLKVMDALSDVRFYDEGLVDIPVPGNNHIDDFLKRDIDERWVYYCSSQDKEVSNRFFAMPSSRCRILGWQLFKFGIAGFLHWGFNFWFSQHSKAVINPYVTTDAGKAFPSGDSFVVYPGKDGPVSSLRLLTLYEALQDMRALELLATRLTRQEITDWLDAECGLSLSFSQYPRGDEDLLTLRQKLNEKIREVF